MKAVVLDRFGEPADVLQVRDIPAPAVGRGQVRVRMLASPVNPSDLMTVRGIYGKRPTLPATPGYEGVGVVEEGRGLLAWRVKGKRVAVLNSDGGNWAEQVVIPARNAVPVPDDLTDEQAATFFVNPATALILTRSVLRVPRGAWLLQSAAGSALGRMVVRLGKLHGFHTINVVRRRAQVEELKKLGADEVIVFPGEDLAARVRELTKSEGVLYAIDCVGGATGSELVRALGRGGRLVLYGTLANEPLTFDPRQLMVGQKRIEGFWLSEWVREQGPLRLLRLFGQIGRLLREGVLDTEVGTTFALEQVQEAVRLAETPGRKGKVVLRIGSR
jgi:NADPH2:quinone reductase